MDNVIKLISVIIWPLIVLFLALFYQGSVKELLGRLKSASTTGLTFSDKAEEARKDADQVAAGTLDDEWVERLKGMAASQPWLAVRQAWFEVRRVAKEKAGGSAGDNRTTPERVRDLRDKELVTQNTYRLTSTLHGLYWDMRKAPEQVNAPAAIDYVEASAAVVKALESAQPEVPLANAEQADPAHAKVGRSALDKQA